MTKTERTLELLRAGWVTPLDCALNGGVWSLSPRVGDLRRAGWLILDRWQTLPSGARVKAYMVGLWPGEGAPETHAMYVD